MIYFQRADECDTRSIFTYELYQSNWGKMSNSKHKDWDVSSRAVGKYLQEYQSCTEYYPQQTDWSILQKMKELLR